MPRIPPQAFRNARNISKELARLLPVCRDLHSAQNELRWLGEHAAEKSNGRNENHLLHQYVRRRARGEPLQYILGTEFFGDLEIDCRPGVLIPRPETAASVTHLVKLLSQSWRKDLAPKHLSILDLCTGTGCIPLLFHHELFKRRELAPPTASFMGVDVSPKALSLAEENKAIRLLNQGSMHSSDSALVQSLQSMQFTHANVLSDSPLLPGRHFDILISNPPYISSTSFLRTTAASVRRFEPKLALVPAPRSAVEDGDAFYPRLLEHASQMQAKVLLFEVADLEQAKRVAEMVSEQGVWDGLEIWRDEPGRAEANEGHGATVIGGSSIKIKGEGNGRSVVAWRGEGGKWVGRD